MISPRLLLPVAFLALSGALDAQAGSSALARYDFSQRSLRADLPGRLDEVSGLAFTPDGRLFAHGDERAWIHEIDTETGEVGKRFNLGDRTVRNDFEGLAIVGERFFLISSGGWLYESREGADRDEMPYRVTDTGVGEHCEVEGLEYHPAWNELLILCKVSLPDRGAIVVHRMPIEPGKQRPAPLLVPRSQLAAFGLGTGFHGSGLALDPTTGHLLIVAAREEALIEVDTDGRVIAGRALDPDRHGQPEGLAIGADGTLFIADEKTGKDARLTLYRPRAAEPGR